MSKARERQLGHLRTSEEREKISRILDVADRCLACDRYQVTDFLEPYIQKLAEAILRGERRIQYRLDGGHGEAERRRLIFLPYDEASGDNHIVWLQAVPVGNASPPGHRDYLGSLLGLGIRREKIGDLLLTESGCAVALDQEMADFILAHWSEAGRVALQVRRLPEGEQPVQVAGGEEKRISVASLRADALIAAIWHVSRGRSSAMITAGQLRINGRETKEIAQAVQEGDILSLRGHGRAIVRQVAGVSKKGRFQVILWQSSER
ncbi:RNA-binding protein [Heliophilum fasciatum]|uniref:RNA-binding protein YlmH n=1 Tax=Heliophilum fasciatum TaxID=35700 RepID=A0A4R2RGM3_9FIRM|nr:YlmH/Sll1252 family protein [Heliophilum fasciatum]MCW2278885.1 RNA-binding protein YlmH [Heliophilum fasciatum]TCP62103.1 RNA-binding protein YlmH [Heliophilum fasciatum]